MTSRHRHKLATIEMDLRKRLADVTPQFGADAGAVPDVALNTARDPAHGDFATPAALAAGKAWRRNPFEIAQAIAAGGTAGLPEVASIEAVRPGFINVRMAPSFWRDVIAEALERDDAFGRSDTLADFGPVLVEFVSANPTGPLVVVQGRSGSLGACLVELFRFAGARAFAETYINDHGTQLDALADSLFARYATLCGVPTPLPEDGYPGEYLVAVAEELRIRDGDRWLHADASQRRRALGQFARDRIVEQQRDDMERFGVHFDTWFSETKLHEAGKVNDVIEDLVRRGTAYEKDGAVWLRATQFGDEKDRVLRRGDGRPTYVAADAAYHRDKLERGNKHLIDILGPDHHGYVPRLKAIVAALGYPGTLEVLIAQQVTLKRGDLIVSMSKRAGQVVTLREVVDEVGVDAARFFFADRAPESHFAFDLRLAVEQSAKNPVYYVQYGHARIASILRRAQDSGRTAALERARLGADLDRLEHPAEFALVRRLADFERTVADAARARAPHRVAEYARDLATQFHAFYTECTVLGDDEALSSARLSLCIAAKTVLASALRLLGVSAPETM